MSEKLDTLESLIGELGDGPWGPHECRVILPRLLSEMKAVVVETRAWRTYMNDRDKAHIEANFKLRDALGSALAELERMNEFQRLLLEGQFADPAKQRVALTAAKEALGFIKHDNCGCACCRHASAWADSALPVIAEAEK